ncbi:hypothetical protein N7457_001803 [Penicillium paradoxum]|uniref:uncharacterized protein n=1 Tax=Penicillium paradoxum TaxID=176176 RepID=UPI002548107F|nr:uncharacterized protein N7457_001803 [Penicillium paradoxum]KAJ5795204.1 hypothetical protein N7457_001803 [Penicillium paradoxum]
MAEQLPTDDHHIFSEFEDPERRSLNAHIVPNGLNRTSQDYLDCRGCWVWLDAFWGTRHVHQWKAQLLSEGAIDTERVYNMITVDTQTREYWDFALCAFRPVSVNAEKTEIHIAFHWLPFVEDGPLNIPIKRSQRVPTTEHIFSDPYYKPQSGAGDNNQLYHNQTDRPITSGYVFKITTDDPKERPLPSIELLQLRWNLSRIAALPGASEDEDGYDGSDAGSMH